jgi:hypothetical protein
MAAADHGHQAAGGDVDHRASLQARIGAGLGLADQGDVRRDDGRLGDAGREALDRTMGAGRRDAVSKRRPSRMEQQTWRSE